jgi:aminoglycoside phosphotransferase (APT) family kinase protein
MSGPSTTTSWPDVAADTARRGSSTGCDLALGPEARPESIARFLRDVAPGEVLAGVRECLPPGAAWPRLRPVRAKLKPGRKLTAEYGVLVDGVERRIAVTWVAPGTAVPGPEAGGEDDARRRGVLAPFLRAWARWADGRSGLTVSPVDDAFPQLVRLHDPAHLRELLAASGVDDVPPDPVVETVRYRPRQRHVVRIRSGPGGPAWFGKVYRDDTGARAVDAAAWAADVLADADVGRVRVLPVRGAYVAADRVAVSPEVRGTSLADVVVLSGAAAGTVVRAAAAALRTLHDAPPRAGLPVRPDARAQAAETLRTAELLTVLPPDAGQRLRDGVDRALDRLSRWPVERAATVHGDLKCENVLVDGRSLRLLDFDRCGTGDPAADVGKFLADLRWWSGGDGTGLGEVFLQRYGTAERGRLARARAYESLFLLRMAARRVQLQDPDWGRRAARTVEIAAAPAGGGADDDL